MVGGMSSGKQWCFTVIGVTATRPERLPELLSVVGERAPQPGSPGKTR